MTAISLAVNRPPLQQYTSGVFQPSTSGVFLFGPGGQGGEGGEGPATAAASHFQKSADISAFSAAFRDCGTF